MLVRNFKYLIVLFFSLLLTLSFISSLEAQVRSLPPGPAHHSSSAPGYCSSYGGSHLYEYIQSASYSQKSIDTLSVTVDIYIANPTGCTIGEPCPEYDSSPEYINVWVDWDGDKVFESNEKIIDDALKGYLNINYQGTMSTSTIVTIPPNSVSSPWMRINLGWGHDPNDPCEQYWTWGDIIDKQLQITPVELKISRIDALDDFSIRNITASIWTDGGTSKPIADGIKNGFGFNTWPGSFKIKATIEASPQKPSWYPKVRYTWSISGTNKQGTGILSLKDISTGWTGEFEVRMPDKVGKYTLNLAFKIYDKEGKEVINSQSMAHTLYATYKNSLLPSPKEVWLDKATEWASGATNPSEIASKILNNIYLTNWTYAPWGHWGWEYTLENHIGDCRDYAWLWKNMNKVLGVPKKSKTIYGSYILKNALGQVIDQGIEPFITKNLRALDGQQKEWKFNFHQIGSDGGFYDPVFNIHRSTKENYEKALLTAFNSTVNANGNWVNVRIDGNDLETLINNKQVSGSFSIGTESFEYVLTLNDQTTEFADPPVNLTVTPAHDAVILETDKLSYELNEPIYITAAYLYNGSALTGLSFFAEIQRPDTSFNIPLYDDGTHGDSQANDGIYSNIFTDTSVEGGYMVKVFVSGTINGVPIEKENSLPNSILVTKTEVIFIDEYSDSGIDTDYDGLYNFLNITIGLNVSTAGNYVISGTLKGNGEDIITTNKIYLTTGIQIVELKFDGIEIRKSEKDGSYVIEITLYNNDSDQIGFVEYITSPYNHTDFQLPLQKFTGNYSDYGVDTDGNGLYDYLAVDIGLEITNPAEYTIEGWLYDKEGNPLEVATTTKYLDEGFQLVVLKFNGISIYQNQVNGPYYVKHLTLRGSGIIDFVEDAYTTFGYEFTEFEMPPTPLVALTGNYYDYGKDTDADGIFDYLTIEAEVILADSGNVFIKARLMDAEGKEIVWAENVAYLEANQPQIIELNFDGEAIFNHGVDGPYYLKDVYIYHQGDPTQADYTKDAYITDFYPYTAFGEVEVLGDLDGDGDIDFDDYQVFRSSLGRCDGDTGFIQEADYDGDGCVTYADYRIWYGYYKNQ